MTATTYVGYRSTRFDDIGSKLSKDVSTTSLAWDRMSARWELVDALESSDHMRDAGERFLPRAKAERPREYHARLVRSFLLPAYWDTLDKLTSRPFSQPVTIKNADRLGEKTAAQMRDVDGAGSDISQFARRLFREALHRGIAHVLVDYPPGGSRLNLAEERQLGVHPWWTIVTAPELIGCRGNERDGLSQIRIRTTRTVDGGQWGEQELDTVRVIDRETYAVWAMNEKAQWQLTNEQGVYRHPDGVPLYTLYFNRHGWMESRPALWDLAEMNLEHWQSKSDQNNLLHVARVPILFRKGWSAEDLQKPLELGGGRAVGTTATDADLRYVEHTGQALGAGQKHLDSIEERMEVAGLQPLMRRANATLATALVVGDAKEENELQAFARLTEEFLERLLVASGGWVGETVPEGVTVDIHDEFGLSARASDDIKDLLAMVTAKPPLLTRESFLQEVKRRALLADTLDVREELERLVAEQSSAVAVARSLMGADDRGEGEAA